MKAITLTQPFTSLVAIGAKQIETRSWQTKYRGPLAIHAAKGFSFEARCIAIEEPFRGCLKPLARPRDGIEGCIPMCLPLGCVVAVCDLVDIYPTQARVMEFVADKVTFDSDGLDVGKTRTFFLPPTEPELSFGDYSPGRYAWFLENVRALPEPVPAKGALGLWEWSVREEEADAE